jgi:hypothetical protein
VPGRPATTQTALWADNDLAQLQPGSLTVRVGDRVSHGQVLGLLGNSGNSNFPHLQFHLTDSPSPLAADGLPFEFRYVDSDGIQANGEEVLTGGLRPSIRHRVDCTLVSCPWICKSSAFQPDTAVASRQL